MDRFKKTDMEPHKNFIDFLKESFRDNKTIYLYISSDAHDEEFKNLLDKNGYNLVELKELNKTNDYYLKNVYPVVIYTIMEK